MKPRWSIAAALMALFLTVGLFSLPTVRAESEADLWTSADISFADGLNLYRWGQVDEIGYAFGVCLPTGNKLDGYGGQVTWSVKLERIESTDPEYDYYAAYLRFYIAPSSHLGNPDPNNIEVADYTTVDATITMNLLTPDQRILHRLPVSTSGTVSKTYGVGASVGPGISGSFDVTNTYTAPEVEVVVTADELWGGFATWDFNFGAGSPSSELVSYVTMLVGVNEGADFEFDLTMTWELDAWKHCIFQLGYSDHFTWQETIRMYFLPAVTLFQPPDDVIGSSSVTITWSQYTGNYFANYKVFYKKSSDPSWTHFATITTLGTTSKWVYGLDSGTSYDFQVKVEVTHGYGRFSNIVSATTKTGGGGGSPFIAPWDGTEYRNDNNVIPLSEVYSRDTLDVVDYYRLHSPLATKDGAYSLKLVEFEDEHSFFDSVALWAVDHDVDVRIAVDPQTGEVFTYEDPESPESAVDNFGRDVLQSLESWDGNSYEGWRGDYIELNFGIVPKENARMVIVADTPVLKTRIYIHVWNGTDWELADTMHHRLNFAEDVVDLSRFVPTQEDLRVRLVGASHFVLEQVGLDTSRPMAVMVQEAGLLSAVHSSGEDVTGLLGDLDASYAELVPDQEILLTFDSLPMGDEARSFIFVSNGHYVHKRQPLQGTEIFIDGLSVSFGAVIPQAPLGEFWDIEIADLLWDFGDGATATGWTASHLYSSGGEHTVNVRITYTDGVVKEYKRTILLGG